MTTAAGPSMKYSVEELPEVFADVEPVPVRDDEGVAAIAYSEEFQTAFGYWRALLARDERSERALQLTATCLQLNPANYTVWHYRRLCLDAVYGGGGVGQPKTAAVNSEQEQARETRGSAPTFDYIPADLQLAASLGGDNPKNYQIWYHRRALLEKVLKQDQQAQKKEQEPSSNNSHSSSSSVLFQQFATAELDYISAVLREDGKNYHAWSHRQWCIHALSAVHAAVWDSELEYARQLIAADRRNNSAWNHRWFVAHRGSGKTALAPATANAELEYVMNSPDVALVGDPSNESPWRYYVAVVKEQIFALQDGASVIQLLCRARREINRVRRQIAVGPSSATATAALIDILEWKGQAEAVREAIGLCAALANEHDAIRQKYWNFRAQQLQTALNKIEQK